MKRYLILPLLALAAVACSQGSGPVNPIAPSSTGSTEMVGDARNSCPSDVPGNFYITSGELIGTRWKNYVQFEPVVKTMRYYVELKRRLSDEPAVAFGSWTLTLSGMPSGLMVNIERYDLPDGIYNARIRSICGDIPQGNWSQWVEFVNGDSSFGPNVPPPGARADRSNRAAGTRLAPRSRRRPIPRPGRCRPFPSGRNPRA